jgi:hypothetical protein
MSYNTSMRHISLNFLFLTFYFSLVAAAAYPPLTAAAAATHNLPAAYAIMSFPHSSLAVTSLLAAIRRQAIPKRRELPVFPPQINISTAAAGKSLALFTHHLS